MASMMEEALAFEPQQTKVISDIEKFDANMEVFEFNGADKDGKGFSYKYVEAADGTKYRVPAGVLIQLKAFLEDDPKQTMFKVKKAGEGMKTSYTLMRY